MTKPLISRFVIYPLASVFLIGLIGSLVAYLVQRGQSFPSLPIGSYSGSVQGFADDDSPVTLFVERLASSNDVLVVVFRDNWVPQLIHLDHLSSDSAVNAPTVYKPLRFEIPGDSLTFSGTNQGSDFTGVAQTLSGQNLHWDLRPTPTSSSLFAISDQLRGDLQDWVDAKANFRARSKEYANIQNQIQDSQQRLTRLETLVEQEELLKQRALSRKEALAKELTQTIETHREQSENIRSLIDDLGVVNRVSAAGRAVEIARRISRREMKWYLANWSDEGDANALAEYLSQNSRVDLVKLQEAYARALEVRRLLHERETEITKIAELRSQSTTTHDRNKEPTTTLPPNSQPRSLWDRIF